MAHAPLGPTAARCTLILGLTLGSVPAQSSVQQLEALERTVDAGRRALRHEELLRRYRALEAALADEPEQTRAKAKIAARLSTLAIELDVLRKAGPVDESRAPKPQELVARLAPVDKNAEEEIALASFCFLCDLRTAGEHALGRARDLDPELKSHTDRMLAEARGEKVPRGGYHRYRGEWMALAQRDCARALDEALEKLHDLGIERVQLPFVPDRERTNLDRFTALGKAGADALRAAAEVVRTAQRKDDDSVREWLSSYARSPRLRAEILEAHAALAPVRKDALALIRRYSKYEQYQVDEFRDRLEESYAAYRRLLARDRTNLDRVTASDAYLLLERTRAREDALASVHAFLQRYARPGLTNVEIRAAEGADVSPLRRLPGRAQSELCDVLWLLAHARAGLERDVLARGAELLRVKKELTPWELLMCEEILADAIEAFNERLAISLDPVERGFAARLNRYRRVLGLVPFELEERCNAAARKHSQEMVDLGYFGHISPIARNRGPTDRVKLEGYRGAVGENCLVGGGSIGPDGAFEAWYNSPGHHRNLVSGGVHLGVGAVDGHRMWTMVAGGSDLTWRSLHRDRSPAEHDECDAAAALLALRFRPSRPTRKQLARQLDAGETATRLVPDILPAVARIAFAAARDPHHPDHAGAPALLRFLADADVPPAWRSIQVAAVAASIDAMRFGSTVAVRQQAFDLVEPLVADTAGYSPSARTTDRRESVLAIRREWEDRAQWRFRQAAEVPAGTQNVGRSGDGPSLDAPLEVLTRPQRLRLAKRYGGGTRTEQAVDRALAWLATVQDEDGAWRARSFVALSPKFEPRRAGMGSADYEIAMTGLALLAFVTSGHTIDQGDYGDVVREGADFLLRSIVDYGKFDAPPTHYMYQHAIATQALCELYAYTADPHIGIGAQLALDYLVWAQHRPSGGWRYVANQSGDMSVTGWVVFALNAGYKARLDVSGFRDALRFVDGVTAPGYYQVGYTAPPGPTKENLRLTAAGMVSRLFLGMSADAPQIAIPSWRLLEHLPREKGADFYYWYYASLAMFQRGGRFWSEWNAALMPTVLALQDTDSRSPYFGSWRPDGNHGRSGGRIYSTALGVLLLTTYYRYDRAPKLKLHPFTGNLSDVTAPYLDAVRSGADPQARTIALAKLLDQVGPSVVPELVRVIRNPKEKPALRKLLAQALVTVAQPSHELLLQPLLDDKDGHVAEYAARALVSITSSRSLDVLTRTLSHGNAKVRAFAAEALGRIGDPAATAPLTKRLERERDKRAKAAIQTALRRIAHREALAIVVDDALGAGAPDQLEVLEGLDLLERAGIAERLLAEKQRAPKLYEVCLERLREHRAAAIPAILIELLASEDLDGRRESVKVLRALTGREFGYDATKPEADRQQVIERWREWLVSRAR